MRINLSYNEVAGRSVERLAALSDGLFGVAMTLLLLELHVPVKEAIQSEHDLLQFLLHLGPELLVYLLSFMTLGIFWIGQQVQLSNLVASERHLTWIHLAFLFAVTLMPFSTELLVEFIHFRTALVLYWLNILLLGSLVYLSWGRALKTGLVKPEFTSEQARSVCHRVLVAQAFYALGAALCLVNTFVSISVIILVQLNFVFAPTYRNRSQPPVPSATTDKGDEPA